MAPVLLKFNVPDINVIDALSNSTINNPMFDRNRITDDDIKMLEKVLCYLKEQKGLADKLDIGGDSKVDSCGE